MKNYQRTKANVVIVIVRPIVVDVRQTAIVRVAANETIAVLESVLKSVINIH